MLVVFKAEEGGIGTRLKDDDWSIAAWPKEEDRPAPAQEFDRMRLMAEARICGGIVGRENEASLAAESSVAAAEAAAAAAAADDSMTSV